ncbi:ELM2 domain containing protein [Forsythia ovata]|uniref:ELM2 domain containing protein n=1 Tax=Forsythia ovata TaxID=205694 RepID=A0ABD1XBT9_9LAMI
MGVKRLFDEEDFQDLSFKQAKRLDCEDKLAPFAEDFPHYESSPKVDLRGDRSNFCKMQLDEALKNDNIDAAFISDKDLETSVPLSWVTSSSGDEGAGFEDTSRWSHFPENFDFLDPSRGPYQFEDGYSSLFNSFPTKKVPIGLTHQADLPPWDPNVTRKDCFGFNCFVENEQKLMGTCIIPMPDLNTPTYNDVEVGCGRRDCGCLDEGSMRCVKQHVNEAQEKLRETFGDENFMELGFYEMGEEVAHKWTEEEEQVFHEVVYSNPVSLGKRFWKHLTVVFPTRTKKEIVCYYFNVFILRRRSVQNRSKLLEIDSDDDEWQGTDGGFCRLEEEDEESIVESFGDQDIHVDHVCDLTNKVNSCRFEDN